MKKLAIISLAILPSLACQGQVDFSKTDYSDYTRYVSIGWNVNVPLSNRDNIGTTSYSGMRFGIREKLSDHFFAGLDLNSFTYNSHTPRQTYFSDGSALTTDYYNYVYSYGATVSGEYYFNPEKRLMPFAGLGVGATYNSYKTFYNVYGNADSAWGLLLRPEAGAILKVGSRGAWGLIASAHYDYSSAKSEMFNYSNFSNVGFRLGIVIFDF